MIKVLIVDDSAFMRKVIADMVESSEKLTVVGTAKNGSEAIRLIKSLKPDVVTLDIEMPVMDGLTALEQIMKESPTPVIMLSSLTKQGAQETLKALDLGAVDFITKPSSLIKVSTPQMREELISKIEASSHARLSATKKCLKPPPKERIGFTSYKPASTFRHFKKVIAIGTSTGGPRALQDVIPYLPKDIDASILIVQHMPPGFTKSLAERLNSMSQIGVKEAEHGDVMQAGWAYIAPGDQHIRVYKESNQLVIKLDSGDRVSGHRPSVDAMLDSIVALELSNVIGVIMTGMGADGAQGMKNLKNHRGYVIAQDEQSCVVYGMPKSAVILNAVDKVVGLSNIANEILKAMEV